MFGTYSVPGTDIVFACIMCVLAMALAYVIGRIHKLKEINESIETFKWSRNWLCKDGLRLEKELAQTYLDWNASEEAWAAHVRMQLTTLKRELSKKHRLALAKYKAKCDTQLSKQISYLVREVDDLK